MQTSERNISAPYADMIEILCDGFWQWNIDMHELEVSPSYKKSLGYEVNEIDISPSMINTWIHPDDRMYIENTLKKYFFNRVPTFEIDYRIKGKDGEYRWFSSRNKVLYDQAQRPKMLIGSHIDITKQKQLEKELKEKENYYSNTFYNNKAVMLIINPSTRAIVDVNEAACQFYGYPRETLLKKDIKDIQGLFEKHHLTELRRVIENKHGRIELPHRVAKGHIRTVEVYISSIEFEGENLLHCIVQDISERKMIERHLLESEGRYKTLIESSPDAIFVHYNEIIEFANYRGAKLLGFNDPKELYGKSIWDFIPKDDIKRAQGNLTYANDRKVNIPLREQKLQKKDGTVIYIALSSTIIPYNGHDAILSTMRDITERKNIQETLRQMLKENKALLERTIEYDKLKTEFFSNISHEFRTPLNIILGSLQLIKNLRCDDYNCMSHNLVEKYTDVMEQNSYRLLRLINNLLDITRIDTKHVHLNVKNYNIVRVIEDITMSVSDYVKSKGIELVFDTNIEEKIIGCDVDQIERIMLNILSNAVKFTDKDGLILVKVGAKDNNIMVSVKDTGIGIPEEKLDIIFDRFRQVHSLMTRRAEGSGIGLALVKELVELHDGYITVESEVGKGTEFIIELPIKEIKDEPPIYDRPNNTLDDKVDIIKIEFSDIYS